MPPPATLLAIDTATTACSVALSLRGAVHEDAREIGHAHTEHVLAMVQGLLRGHGAQLADCAAIAFGAGPGSFTGLRIACGIAQGLAFGIDRPVVPVSNLAAAAADAFERRPGVQSVLVVLDARMSEVYWGVYSRSGARPAEMAPAALAAPADLPELCRSHGVEAVAGNGLAVCGDHLVGFAGERIGEATASASSVVRLAVDALRAGGGIDAAFAAPLYVRERVALTIDERRAQARAPH